METIRVNVSIPKDVFVDMSKEIEARKRSQFITEAIKRLVKEKREQRLASEYQEAAGEIRRINQELEGAVNDGLD
jgi:metal-responsive CopG/Arc/MetJ family transcriptional regulator